MKSLLHQRTQAALTGALGAIAVVLVTWAALSSSSSSSGRAITLALVALVAILGLLIAPVESLPAVAFALVVFVPDRLLDSAGFPLTTPSAVVLGVWALRRALSKHSTESDIGGHGPGRKIRVAAVILFVWLVIHTVSSALPSFSIAWTTTFLLAVVLPLLVRDTAAEATKLTRAWPWIASIAAGYVLLQGALQSNVIFDPLYDIFGRESAQHWEVYRADGSFGHPLNAGLFFAASLAFCAGLWIETRRSIFVVAAGLQAAGLMMTVSRGSYLAAAVAVGVLVLASLLVGRRVSRGRSVLIFAGFGIFVWMALQSGDFVQRALSEEAVSSTEVRENLWGIVLNSAQSTSWLGGGVAASTVVAAPFNFQGLPIENGYFQLLLGVGLPGATLFVALILVGVLRGIRLRNLAGASALTGFAVAVAGFASLDSNLPLVSMLGLLLLLCCTQRNVAATSRGSDTFIPEMRTIPSVKSIQ